jgi:hypothetical protein
MPVEADRDVIIDQEQRSEGMRVSWGGVWAGVLVALGTLLLLSTLGLAVGIAANTGPGTAAPGTVGTAAAIWSGLSLLISLFLGGMASTRLGRISDRSTGMFEGALVWVITLGAILYLGVRGLELVGASGAAMGFNANDANTAANAAANAATVNPGATRGIGWSPFIIAALSLLASLAGAASGLRRLFDGSSSRTTSDASRTSYDAGRTTSSSTTTTTTTTRDPTRDPTRDRDRNDRY